MTRKRLVYLVVFYLVLMGVYAYVTRKFAQDISAAGQFGDMFGCFTALVNGLALLGVCYTIYLQNSAHVVATLDMFHRRWNEPSMLRTRLRACERIIDNNENRFSQSMQHIAEYFEHMGTLAKLQAIDTTVLWSLYSWYIESYWYMFKDWINDMRVKNKDSSAYTEFEWLFKKMSQITQSKNLPNFDKTRDELLEFARSDKKLAERLLAIQSEQNIIHYEEHQ